MDTFERALMRGNRWALIVLLAAMSLIIFANVVLRYATSQSIEWAEEVARYLMVWLTFLGAGPVLRYGGHIAVDNLQDKLTARAAAWMRGVIAALMFGFFGVMVVYGVLYVQRAQFQLTPTTQVSMAWVYAAIPVGGLLLALHWALVLRGYVGQRAFAADGHFDAAASASL